jgi:membrane-associated phospholipid phosphatase
MIQRMDLVAGKGGVRSAWLARVARRVVRRRDGRAPLWIELAIVVWLFWLYDVINDLAPLRHALALRNAVAVLHFERSLGLDPELSINRWLASHTTLALIASYDYFFSHAIVTFAVLVLLWWRLPRRYIRLRTVLVIINLIAFAVFWRYPLAPPRSFPALGYIDVIARSNALVSWHSGVLVHDADQFAAMPSLHIAWAMWSAIGVWYLTRRVLIRVLAVAYPILTAFVVLGTGNHYLVDVVAGAATVALAFAVQLAFTRLAALLRRRRGRRAHADVPAHAHATLHPHGTHEPEHAVRSAPAQP